MIHTPSSSLRWGIPSSAARITIAPRGVPINAKIAIGACGLTQDLTPKFWCLVGQDADRPDHLKTGRTPHVLSELNRRLLISPLCQAHWRCSAGFLGNIPIPDSICFFGNLFGPNERLLDGNADLIIHHVDKSDSRYEYRDFCQVQVVPVVAPGFLDLPISRELRYADLEGYTQCIIRDTSTHSEKLNRLISIAGKYIKGITREIVIARLSAPEKGIVAERLWQSF